MIATIRNVSIVCLVLLLGASVARGQFYDLAADWSDVNNPNGAWALFKAPGVLFDVVQADWYGNGTNQPAWADATNANPFPPTPQVPKSMTAVSAPQIARPSALS